MFNQFVKNLPVFNFITSVTALAFQITVLYPWHKEISVIINEISKKIQDR